MTTFERLMEILRNELNADTEAFTEETGIYETGFDSLDLVDAVMAVEEEFKIEISDEDFKAMKTLGDICEYIEERMN